MELIISIFIAIIAALHTYFLWFEMFAWETTGARVFRGFPKDFYPQSKSMAANQGLYNGFLVAGLVWTFFISDPIWKYNIALFFLGCVAVAGIFGAITVSKKIFYVQGLPALIAIALVLLK